MDVQLTARQLLFPPRCVRVSQRLQHQLARDLGRADDESGVSWPHPCGYALRPVVDTNLVANLGDALGERYQRLEDLAECWHLLADPVAERPSDCWARFTSAGTFVTLGVGQPACGQNRLGRHRLGRRLDERFCRTDGQSRVGLDGVSKSGEVVQNRGQVG